MNLLFPVSAGVMGFGGPELLLIVTVLTLLASPLALLVWFILHRRKQERARATPSTPPQP